MRRHLAALSITLSALALTGCGADTTAKADATTPSATPTPTTSPPTPIAPSMPAAAQAKTRAGAEAFVEHYFAVMAHAGSTGVTDELRALSDPDCAGCKGVSDLIEKTYQAGGSIVGGGWHLTSATFYGQDGNRLPVDVLVSYAPQTFVQLKGGKAVKSPSRRNQRHYLELGWTGGRWSMTGLDDRA